MKILAIFLVILAVVISVVPQFTDCESHGRSLTLADGREVAMKCHWTARAEIVVGIPLFVLAGTLFFASHKGTRINLGILGIILGALTILLPTVLIGVCTNPDMVCNLIMKPTLLLTGGLVIIISIIITVVSLAQKQAPPPAG